jgi:hypothetical protein
MARDELDIEGIDVNTFFTKVTAAGVSSVEAKSLIANLLVRDRLPRRFHYATPFPAEDPACTPAFDRTFRHVDWVDGESVVQAEETTGEDGFNKRFHRIESDLDALGADVALTFACMAGMRRNLRSLLDEIRVEVDRLNDLVADDGGPIRPLPLPTPFPRPGIEFLGKTKVGNLDKFILREGDEFRLVDLDIGSRINPTGPVDWIQPLPRDSVVDVIRDATETIRTNPDISNAIRTGATAEEIRINFGDTTVATAPGGEAILLGDVLRDVPAGTTFIEAADPAAAVITSGVLATGVETSAILRATVLNDTSRNLGAAELLDSSVSVLAPVSVDFARDLETAGVANVDTLARASTVDVVTALNTAGVTNVDSAAVSRAITAARIARSVGRIGG